jgi:hypothetical protein
VSVVGLIIFLLHAADLRGLIEYGLWPHLFVDDSQINDFCRWCESVLLQSGADVPLNSKKTNKQTNKTVTKSYVCLHWWRRTVDAIHSTATKHDENSFCSVRPLIGWYRFQRTGWRLAWILLNPYDLSRISAFILYLIRWCGYVSLEMCPAASQFFVRLAAWVVPPVNRSYSCSFRH